LAPLFYQFIIGQYQNNHIEIICQAKKSKNKIKNASNLRKFPAKSAPASPPQASARFFTPGRISREFLTTNHPDPANGAA
jgi:hypothetical protein